MVKKSLSISSQFADRGSQLANIAQPRLYSCPPERSEGPVWLGGTTMAPQPSCRSTANCEPRTANREPRTIRAAMNVEVIRDSAKLEALAPEWLELWRRSPD